MCMIEGMKISNRWTTVHFREPVQLHDRAPAVPVTRSMYVHLDHGWVHIDVTKNNDPNDAQMVSVPSALVTKVDWTSTTDL
jgi:hypothetical protein